MPRWLDVTLGGAGIALLVVSAALKLDVIGGDDPVLPALVAGIALAFVAVVVALSRRYSATG